MVLVHSMSVLLELFPSQCDLLFYWHFVQFTAPNCMQLQWYGAISVTINQKGKYFSRFPDSARQDFLVFFWTGEFWYRASKVVQRVDGGKCDHVGLIRASTPPHCAGQLIRRADRWQEVCEAGWRQAYLWAERDCSRPGFLTQRREGERRKMGERVR